MIIYQLLCIVTLMLRTANVLQLSIACATPWHFRCSTLFVYVPGTWDQWGRYLGPLCSAQLRWCHCMYQLQNKQINMHFSSRTETDDEPIARKIKLGLTVDAAGKGTFATLRKDELISKTTLRRVATRAPLQLSLLASAAIRARARAQ